MEPKNQTSKTKPTLIVNNNSKPLMMNRKKPNETWSTFSMIAIVAVVVLGGVTTGYVLAGKQPATVVDPQTGVEVVKTAKVVGSLDKQFKDEATGKLEKGGMNGEGTHHLTRDGGPSQNVYLTSSVINLDDFAGKNVKVWGETFAAQKAGWLMDVGKLEVLD